MKKAVKVMNSTLYFLDSILHWLEILIAIVIVAFVIIGGIATVKIGIGIDFAALGEGFYHTFESMLSNVLLIIIGVELAILLIRRSPESLIEVMFFVVARKMLVMSHNIWDLVIGVAAIAGLFAVRKYLEHTTPERHLLFTKDENEEIVEKNIKKVKRK